MDSGHCLDVVVGRPSSPRQLPEGPCLLVEAKPFDRETWLGHADAQMHPWPLSFEHCVLTGVDGQSVTWNEFSDQRFDGPLPLSEFISMYPNLRLIGSHNMSGISLASILKQNSGLLYSGSTFRLTLRQGDPCQTLCGAGQWLDRCSRVSLRGSCFGVQFRLRAEQQLKAACFRQSEDDPAVWFPEVKMISAKRWSRLWDGLKSLFDVDAYRLIRPHLSEYSESELLQHWLAEPDLPGLREAVRLLAVREPRCIDEMSDQETSIEYLLSIFPFDYYRSCRPDLASFTDRELLNHFWNLGRTEGSDLSESAVRAATLQKAEIELQLARGRIEQLEQLLASTLSQLDSLHQLVDDVSTSGGLDD